MNLPWVTKLEEEIKAFDEIINRKFKAELKNIKKHPREAILKRSLSQKKYDIYHSTTIEGYAITPEEIEAVILGTAQKEKGSLEKIKNDMAILGHANAFEYVLAKIKSDFGQPTISEDLIAEIYFQLFKPSVDAKIIDKFDLLGYRRIKVYIRNSLYVPPSFEKVPDLIKYFVALVGEIKNGVVKAILAHYFFVTIHPYPDGNGRCARLLMNYLLAASGYHWVTITADKREPYFQTLQKGQIDSDIIPFAEFVLSFLVK